MTQQESQNRIKRPALLGKLASEASSLERDCDAETSFLADAAQLAGFGTYTLNLTSGECDCSKSLRSILRIDSNDNAHICLEKGIEESHRVNMARSLAKLIASGGEDLFEHEYCSSDGKTSTLRTRRLALRNDELPTHKIVCCIQDISEERQSTNKLRESELRYRTLMDFATDSFMLHSQDGVIVDVNQRACESYGYTKSEFIGQIPSFYSHSLNAERLQWIYGELEKGHTISYDAIHRRKNGSTFPAEVRIRPIVLQGKRFALTLSRDITEQRTAVAALEGQSRIFELIATGQSLTSILGEITLFVEQVIPESICYISLADSDARFRINREDINDFDSCWTAPIFEVAPTEEAQQAAELHHERPVVGTLAVCRRFHGTPNEEASSSMGTAVRLAEIAISRIRAVQELRESEKRYTVMSEVSRIVTFGLSRACEGGTWKIDWSRPQIGMITGFSPQEILGASWEGLIHADDHPKCLKMLSEIVSSKTSKVEVRLVTKSGQAVNVQIHLKLDKFNSFSGAATLIGGLQDISEFKAVESALRKSEERFDLAVSGTNDGLWDWNLLTNEAYYSPRWKAMLGFEPDELENDIEAWTSLLHPEDAESAQSKLEEFLNSQSNHYDLEFRMRTKQGDYRMVQSKGTLSRDANGVPIRMVGTHRDLTEQKTAELALRRSEEFLRRAQVVAHVGNWTLDLETQVFECSEEAARIFELAGTTCTLEDWLRLVHPDDLSRIRMAYTASLGGENFEMEYRLVLNGRMKWVSSKATLELDGTYRTRHLVGVTQDISARTKLEEQLRQSQKMEAFGQLAGGVAHDFNNLLTVINGFSELLLGEIPKGEPRREYVEQIQEAGERAAGLTRQLLTLGRRQFTEPRVIDLNVIVARSEAMLKRLIGEDILVQTDYYDDLPNIKADPGQIDQVILNLAVNARDAMPSGGRLNIETGIWSLEQSEAPRGLEDLSSGDYVQLVVSDTGMGMNDEVKARIFEPFFSTKGVGKGTGLGLSTVYGIVKQNHGAITVESEHGAGATFRILFPIERAQVTMSKIFAPLPLTSGSETILLAEDEGLVRQIVITTLESRGYRVLAANSGEAALELASQYSGTLHILITDMVMPGITGTELAERLKNKYPDLRVLYMSGYTEDKVVRLGLFTSPDDFIQKPFTPTQLNRSVHQLLHGR